MQFLGEDLLAWLVLAMGGALAVGNLLALVKPPPTGHPTAKSNDRGNRGVSAKNAPDKNAPDKNAPDKNAPDKSQVQKNPPHKKGAVLKKAPLWRSILMILLGTLASIWALASLLS